MSFLYADMIGIDVHPLVLAREWTAARMRSTLESLAAVAATIGVGDVWSSATLFGTDVGAKVPVAATGITMSGACFPGVGFSRDEDLRRAYPRSVDIVSGKIPVPPEAEKLRAWLTAILTAQSRQSSAVVEVASAAKDAVPVCASIDIEADESFEFDEAYRRRLAYALGFAASLEAGSMAPYLSRQDALLRGELDDVIALCSGLGGFSALSIAANLLARLGREIASLEVGESQGRPTEPPIPDVAAKQRWLESELQRAAEVIRHELNEDGRAALAGLLSEVEHVRQDPHGRHERHPAWGRIATRDEYGLRPETA